VVRGSDLGHIGKQQPFGCVSWVHSPRRDAAGYDALLTVTLQNFVFRTQPVFSFVS
jgi:hypothetical protein